MSEAFPDVSWVFLFRDPVEVMVSNLKVWPSGGEGRDIGAGYRKARATRRERARVPVSEPVRLCCCEGPASKRRNFCEALFILNFLKNCRIR